MLHNLISIYIHTVGANLIETEKLEIGGVKWEVYAYYAKSIGWLFSGGTFLLYFIYQVIKLYLRMLNRPNLGG